MPELECADLPMSVLSLYYLIRSIDECISSSDAHRAPSTALVVCDLRAGFTNILTVLSVVTSAAMLMYFPALLGADRGSVRPG